MKLSARDAARYLAKPDPSKAGLLIYGPDGMRVALKRQQAVAALLGPDGPADMRLTRIAPGDLRSDPAALEDAMRARGFFPGQRVVLLDGAPDGIAAKVETALSDWAPGDAVIVATAGNLTPRSALRKLFEGHANAYAAAVYADAPSRDEVAAMLSAAGLRDLPEPALADLNALAAALDPGEFGQTVEKLALYKHSDDEPVSPEDIAAVAPLSTEAELDDMLGAVADGRADRLAPIMRRLQAQGQAPVSLAIGALRHFRLLHAIAAHPGGAREGVNALRPPLYGPRRDRMQRQAGEWGAPALERAIGRLVDTDLALRSGGQTAPEMALIERALFGLAFLKPR